MSYESATVYKDVDTKINAVCFAESCFFMSLKCLVFRTSSCEWTDSNGVYTTSYSIALEFLSMTVVLRVFANAML